MRTLLVGILLFAGCTSPDDVASQSLSISAPATVSESGKAVRFTVSLSAKSRRNVSFDFDTADGTAKAGDDYGPWNGRITLKPGTLSTIVAVAIRDDKVPEASKTFSGSISKPQGATIAKSTATVTITDDDSGPAPTPNPVPTPTPQPNPDPNWKTPFTHDSSPWVNRSANPANFNEGIGWGIAAKDPRRSDAGTVEIDWMKLHVTVNGQDRVIATNDYGNGKPQISGDYGSLSQWFQESGNLVAAGYTDDAVTLRVSDQPTKGYHWWMQPRGQFPSGTTDVWVEARIRITGSAVVEVGVDMRPENGNANRNGSGLVFHDNTNGWQVVTAGKP